jgi:hypothetical protein
LLSRLVFASSPKQQSWPSRFSRTRSSSDCVNYQWICDIFTKDDFQTDCVQTRPK